MKKTLLFVCFLIITCIVFAQRTVDEISHKTLLVEPFFVWPSSIESSRNVAPKDVLDLLQRLFPSDGLEEVYAMESFRFVPLEKDRKDKLYLVADTDVTGRGIFGRIQIVKCEGRECIMTGQGSDGPTNLGERIVDVDGDGIFEIVTRNFAGTYDGPLTRPIYIYFIRKLIGGRLVDVSVQFPTYFRDHILPMMAADRMEAQRALADYSKPADRNSQAVDDRSREGSGHWKATTYSEKVIVELQYVQDEYHRRVLREKTAGLDNALRWARSDDPAIQQFAIQVLEPIDSSLAAAELDRLAHSPNATTAKRARDSLDNRRENGLDPPIPPAKE